MTHPLNPNAIVQRLVTLSKMLDDATAEIEQLDEEAVRAKSDWQVAHAREFVTASGAMDMRKELAVLAAADKRLAYELADAKTRACKERIRTLRDQIEIGRSLGAAVRAEWSASGYTNP